MHDQRQRYHHEGEHDYAGDDHLGHRKAMMAPPDEPRPVSDIGTCRKAVKTSITGSLSRSRNLPGAGVIFHEEGKVLDRQAQTNAKSNPPRAMQFLADGK